MSDDQVCILREWNSMPGRKRYAKPISITDIPSSCVYILYMGNGGGYTEAWRCTSVFHSTTSGLVQPRVRFFLDSTHYGGVRGVSLFKIFP